MEIQNGRSVADAAFFSTASMTRCLAFTLAFVIPCTLADAGEKPASSSAAAALNPEWHLFVRPGVTPEDVRRLTAIPEKLGGAVGRRVRFTDHRLEISDDPAHQAEAVLLNEFDAPDDGSIKIGCAADWYFDLSVNGRRVYDTLRAGNGRNDYSLSNHRFEIPVKKGKNLVAVRVLSGSLGWMFLCGPIAEKDPAADAVTIIRRDAEWRPVKMDNPEFVCFKLKRIDSMKVLPGTALDLSRYFPRFDIDQNGRLAAGADGRLEFADAPGVAARLRGVNMLMGNFRTGFYSLTHAELEELAEQIRIQGFNMLRFHMLANAICGYYGPTDRVNPLATPGKKLADDPGTLVIDHDYLDRLDYFIKCCRDRGIYLMLDIAHNGSGWSVALPRYGPKDFRERMEYGLMFRKEYRENWRAGFKFLMRRENPYTGKRLVDDPQVFAITFINEQEHLFNDNWKVFDSVWRGRYPDAPAYSRELLESASEDGARARRFLLDSIDDTNEFYIETAREIGFAGLVTNWDMFMRNLEGYARRNMGAVSLHTYFAHPNTAGLTTKYPQKRSFGGWLRGRVCTTAQNSSITAVNHWIGRAAPVRVLGKPFILNEYSHSGYNAFTHESGLVVGAYAALQGWDALAPHNDLVQLYYEAFHPYSFDSGLNVSAKISSLLTAFAWRRGDVAEAKKSVQFHVPRAAYEAPAMLGAIGGGYNALFMLTRLGGSYLDQPEFDADLTIVPKQYSGARGEGMYAVVSESASDQRGIQAEMVEKLRGAGILPPSNRTDVAHGIYQSETGEITTDVNRKTMTVVTPRFEAAVCAADAAATPLDGLTIRSVSRPCTIAAVSLEEDKPLRDSGHILLVAATMFAAENSVWTDNRFQAQIDTGDYQLLCRSLRFEIKLQTNRPAAPKIHALNLNGTREREIPAVFEDGVLSLTLDTSELEYGTPYFEIVY